MADIIEVTTDDTFEHAALKIFAADGVTPALVDGIPVWESSNKTVLRVDVDADGMGGLPVIVAPSSLDTDGKPIPERITVSADADLGGGVKTITGVSKDVVVKLGTKGEASILSLDLTVTPKA